MVDPVTTGIGVGETQGILPQWGRPIESRITAGLVYGGQFVVPLQWSRPGG
jgi:hypothetical protein